MPHITVTFHNSHTNADETYSGVRVADLLRPLGAPLGSELRGIALTSYLVATGADGYKAVLALAEIDEQPRADDDRGAGKRQEVGQVAEKDVAEDDRPDDHRVLLGDDH